MSGGGGQARPGASPFPMPFGGGGMMPMPTVQPSPLSGGGGGGLSTVQAQIQALLAGKAQSPLASQGMGGGGGNFTPGMMLAQSMIPQTKEGGGMQGGMGGGMIGSGLGSLAGLALGPIGGLLGGALGGPVGGWLGNVFGANNRSAMGDIAGALALGRPISDESWAAAGYGPGGIQLGSK